MRGSFWFVGFVVFLNTVIPRSRAITIESLYLLMVVVLAGGTIFHSDILTQNLYISTNDLLGRGLRPSVFKGGSGSWSNFVENPPYYDVDVYSWDRSFLLAPSIDGGLVPSFLVFQDCHLQCHILSSVKTPCASYRFVSFFWTALTHTRSGSYKPGNTHEM